MYLNLDCPAHVEDLLGECWQTTPDQRPSMQRVVTLISAGNLHYLSKGSRDDGTTKSTAQLDALERELKDVVAPLERFRIKPTNLDFPKVERMTGEGGYGQVYQALLRPVSRGAKGDSVAVKKLRTSGGRYQCLRIAIALIRELSVWATLSHDHIIPLVGFHLSSRLDQAWLASPYMANGNILEYLRRVATNEENRLRLALDTANGLKYLHGLDPVVCHGDIKAANVLINDQHRAMLCDFGLAKAMETLPSGLTTTMFNHCGSLRYQSPELVLNTSPRSPQSDVWAWGCLLKEILTEKRPYHLAENAGAITKWIIEDIPPAHLHEISCPGYIRVLLSYCWQARPSARPTMDQCVSILSRPLDANSIFQQLQETRDGSEATVLRRTDISFTEKDRIGSGCFGAVYQAKLVDVVPKVVAVKQLFVPKDTDLSQRLHEDVVTRVNEWRSITHPNVLKLVGYYPAREKLSNEILLVFPYVSGGNLTEYLKTSLDYSQKVALASDVCQGLLYLHSRSPPVYHGSLHPNNILIGSKGHAILNDYDIEALEVREDDAQADAQSKRYRSPERLTNMLGHVSGDVWSFGCVFLKVITGNLPYQDTNDAVLVNAVSQKVLPAPIDDLECPPRVQNILGLCWQWDPESRATIGEVATILSGRLCKFEETRSTIGNRPVECLKFSHDGKYLVVAFGDCIRIYEAETGNLFCELLVSERLRRVQMSRSQKLLVASSRSSHSLMLWNLETRELTATYKGHEDSIRAFDISPDETILVSCSDDQTIRSWQINGRNTQPLATHRTTERPRFLTFHNSSPTLAVSYWDVGVRMMDYRDWKVIAELPGQDLTWVSRFSPSPDSQRLYGGSPYGSLCFWEVEDLLKPSDTPRAPVSSTKIDGVRSPVRAINASQSWIVFISGKGDVNTLDIRGEAKTPSSIGRVNSPSYCEVVDLGPVSEEGVGLAAACPRGSQEFTLYRYQSWDKAGVYKSRP